MKHLDKQGEERLAVALALSAVGGFLDIYTYLYRGGVFANAITGNIVLLGLRIAMREWPGAAICLVAILSYAFGVLCAEFIAQRSRGVGGTTRHRVVLLAEGALLLVVHLLPSCVPDFLSNAVVAFVCALQVQTFRRVAGLPFASTMCTGNMRSGSEELLLAILRRKMSHAVNSLHYFGVILSFILGAGGGSLLFMRFGQNVFLLAPLALFAVALALWRW
ncbi:MAG: YoaK family protein [Oligosphaeraceae bacterium]